jgi:hypothetical protein
MLASAPPKSSSNADSCLNSIGYFKVGIHAD